MEDDLNFFENGRQPHFFQMEDNLNLIQIEDDLNNLVNGRQPQKIIIQPKTIQIKTMVVAPLRVT